MIVGDAGDVYKIDATNYANAEVWPVTKDGVRKDYDLEGITVADESSDQFYLVDEREALILELDFKTQGYRRRCFNSSPRSTSPCELF